MPRGRRWGLAAIAAVTVAVLAGLWTLQRREAERFGFGVVKPGRVLVTYWEKWTGFEKDGMESIVKDFNESQDRIQVEYVSVSGVNQKTLVATAGGKPPDVAGLWDQDPPIFADKHALTPLDDFCREARIGPRDYIPVYWDMCTYQNHVWALPSTPATTALHYNRQMFRDAGLDPNRPPRTFAELDAFSRKITRVDPETHRIEIMGFLPPEPGWWHYGWGSFFGGKLWDGKDKVLFDAPPYVEAFTWIKGYADLYGIAALQTFQSGFGQFSTPQNPFMSGHVAMVLQGVWMANFIAMNNPKLDWAAAPFPVVHRGDPPVTFAGCDMLVIPRGAKHPREAFEFIRFVQTQREMEKLCLSHRKNSPLRKVSERFFHEHKNPFIRMFQQIAWSPNAVHQPKMSAWYEYSHEITVAFDRVWLGQATVPDALHDVTVRVQRVVDHDALIERQAPTKALQVAPFLLAFGLLLVVLAVAVVRELAVRREAGGLPPDRLWRALRKGLLFASPWLVGLGLFVLYPIAASIIYAFCDYSVLAAPKWVGWLNFTTMMHDDVFWTSLRVTFVYAAFALPLGLLLSLAVALLLDTNVRGVGVYRTLYFLPSVTPLVASVMIWMWMFNAQYGVVNDVLGRLTGHWLQPVPWLTDPKYAMAALVFMSFWGIGHTVVILLAALQDVPVSLYEAADLDGANWLTKVRHVTVPMISPVIYFNAIMGVIGALQVFAVPYIMTNGGPANATTFYALYLYQNAFNYLKMGYACAMAWILFLIILALTGAAVRVSRTFVYYVGS